MAATKAKKKAASKKPAAKTIAKKAATAKKPAANKPKVAKLEKAVPKAASNPELEAMIDESPDDPEGYLVYADWLSQQNDPRGELIIAQHGQANGASLRFDRAERDLFKTHHALLLGPLAKWTKQTRPNKESRSFSWRYGFIRAARLFAFPDSMRTILKTLFTHPSGRFIERLALGGMGPRSVNESYPLIAKHAPKTLRWLLIGDCYIGMQTDTDLKELWPNLPKSVKSLTVMRNVERIALTTENDHLEELDLTLQPRMLVDLAKPKWSALKKLHLRTFAAGMSYPFVDILRSAPKLEHLAVTDWRERSEIARDANNQVYLDQSIITSDELGVSAAMAAAGRGLARLDLEMGLTESAIRSLLNSELSSIGQLNIAQHAGIDAKLRAEAERACRNLNWVDPPEERDLADLSDLV